VSQTLIMERLAEWIWRRWSCHFEAVLLAAGTLTSLVFVQLPSVLLVLQLFFHLPLATLLTWTAISLAQIAVIVPVAAAITGRHFFSLVRRWTAGDREIAEDLLSQALAAPRVITVSSGLALLPILTPTVTAFGANAVGGSWQAYVAIPIVVVLLIAMAMALVGIGFEELVRPVLREVAQHLGGGMTGGTRPAWWSVDSRLQVVAALLAWAVAMGSVAVATQFSTNATRFLAALLISVTGSVVVMVGYFRVFGLQPVLRPIGDLIAGTTRVAEGDLSGRLLVTSDDELGVLTESFNTMVDGLAERERLHSAFGSYVDPALAERLLAQGDELFQGEEVEVTIFFADIRNFTTYAEHATAAEAVARLNSLWDILVPTLRDHHGHANKFLGDGVLAVFGVPEEISDHADQAVAAACEIQQRVQATFGTDLRIGIGINTGTVIAGTIGGGGKLEFTLIGDPVNVAARVEQLTKETGDSVLLTQATVDALGVQPRLEERGSQVVRGRDARVNIYAIDPHG
jgi:adenylate cyclase